MTKEALKKEAKEKASIYVNRLHTDNGNVSDTPFSAYDVFVAYEKGALDFAEPREKQIAHLEQSLLDIAEKSVKRVSDFETQIKKMKRYLPVDKRDSKHKWFAYKNLFDTKWKIDYSIQGGLPKCDTIQWFENKEAAMFYLVSNGMNYYEESRR